MLIVVRVDSSPLNLYIPLFPTRESSRTQKRNRFYLSYSQFSSVIIVISHLAVSISFVGEYFLSLYPLHTVFFRDFIPFSTTICISALEQRKE